MTVLEFADFGCPYCARFARETYPAIAAEFVRLGSLHRNTFIDSPRLLRPTLQLRLREGLFLAGQMIGVEGYVESAAAGLLAAINAARLAGGSGRAGGG